MKVQKIARQALPVALASVVVGGLTAFVSLPAGEVTPVAAKAVPAPAAPGGVGFLVAGSHLAYSNDGSGGYSTVGPDGMPCMICGPSRTSMNMPFDAGVELDGITFAGTDDEGFGMVVALERGAWPVAPSQPVTKVVKAGRGGLLINGSTTDVVVDVVPFDSESGVRLGPGYLFETGIAVNAMADRAAMTDRDMLKQVLDGQESGARLLAAFPGEGAEKAKLLILDISSVVEVPECDLADEPGVHCVSTSSGGSAMAHPETPTVAKKVGAVTLSSSFGGSGGARVGGEVVQP